MRPSPPWRDLPDELGSFQTARKRLIRWAVDGTWEAILGAVLAAAEADDDIDWTVSVDSTVVRAHHHAAGARKRGRSAPASPPTMHSDAPAAADAGLDGIICYFTFGDHFPHIFRRLAQTLAELKTPSWLIWACPPEGALTGTAPGLVHTSIASLMRALPGHLRTPPGEPAGTSAPPDAAASAARALAHLPSRPGVVTETTASGILRELGVPYVECLDVETAAAAQTPAEGNRGPDAQRFVVKVDSPDAPHRARLGLLRLGAHGADVPEEAAALRRQAADQDLRDAHIVVQPQLSHRGELSIGAVRDPSYGPALIVGAGGSRAEDTSAARHAILLPAAPAAVQHTAAALAAEHPGLDAKELARILFLVAEFVSRAPTVAELDINPLLVRDDGSLTAVDSLMVLATPEPSTSV